MPGLLSQLPPQTMSGLLKQAPNQAAGLTRGLLYGGLGAPVDLANMMLLGAGGQRPVGGSAWLEGKLDPYLSRMIGQPTEGQGAARFVGDVVAPGPGEFAGASKAIQGLLADPATATKLQQMVGGLLGMTAYHASPHKFDKFELSSRTIGTGEGAQAYGHGLYFAESPALSGKGGQYYKAFAKDGIRNRYLEVLPEDAESGDVMAAVSAGQFGPELSTLLQRLNDEDWLGFDYPSQALNAITGDRTKLLNSYDVMPETLKAADDALGSSAFAYTVDIPDDQIAKMLDWDKPLLDQSQKVKNLAKTMLPPGVYERLLTQRTGDFVESLAIYNGGKAKASELLRQSGIPGIKYLDGSSRKAGEGTRNFVVFDDSIIKILNRE